MLRRQYRIRRVDFDDDDILELLDSMHSICFPPGEAPKIDHDQWGLWWIAYHGKEPVGFASLVKSRRFQKAGYLYRAGVLPAHRGHGLQKRLIEVRVKAAKRMKWVILFTDTHDSPASTNSLIAKGFKIYEPKFRYGHKHAIYLRRWLRGKNGQP